VQRRRARPAPLGRRIGPQASCYPPERSDQTLHFQIIPDQTLHFHIKRSTFNSNAPLSSIDHPLAFSEWTRTHCLVFFLRSVDDPQESVDSLR
jgi:hypothetical protein